MMRSSFMPGRLHASQRFVHISEPSLYRYLEHRRGPAADFTAAARTRVVVADHVQDVITRLGKCGRDSALACVGLTHLTTGESFELGAAVLRGERDLAGTAILRPHHRDRRPWISHWCV